MPAVMTHIDLADRLLEVYATFRVSSLDDFCYAETHTAKFKEEGLFMPMSEFHALYQQWCSARNVREVNVTDSLDVLARHNLAKVEHRSARTEVYTRIAWKPKGKGTIKPSTIAAVTGETASKPTRVDWTSLDAFIHKNCIVTTFDYDVIFCTEFESRYAQFCADGGWSAMPIRDRDMSSRLHRLDPRGRRCCGQ